MTQLVETPVDGAGASARAGFEPLRVARVDRLTDDAVALTFEVPPDLRDRFAFAAGQSLTLRRVVDGVEHRRSYSICAPVGSAPRVGVREVPGGVVSSWLVHEVRVGDLVEVAAPSGSFRVGAGTGGRHLCIAAGSGITPMLSIAETVLADPGSRVSLLYANRTTRSVMFAEELADLKNRAVERLDLVHVLSREPREVELFSGRLDAERLTRLLRTLVPLDDVDHVWLCGPFGLLETAQAVLAELGVAPDRVHVEHFYVDEPPPAVRRVEEVATGETTAVTVVLDGRSTTAAVARDTTVLDSAQQVRGDLPFACKGGVCGTCRAKVTSGEVDMVRNYALEPAEVEAGFVLTCQSFPMGEAVAVDFDA